MKKIITFLLILCSVALLFCGCGKKEKNTSESGNVSGTESQESVADGIDGVPVDDMDEDTVVVDFETGSIISVPSGKNDTAASSSTGEILIEAGQEPSLSSGSSSSSSSGVSGSSTGSSSNGSGSSSIPSNAAESQDTMAGFGPWE